VCRETLALGCAAVGTGSRRRLVALIGVISCVQVKCVLLLTSKKLPVTESSGALSFLETYSLQSFTIGCRSRTHNAVNLALDGLSSVQSIIVIASEFGPRSCTRRFRAQRLRRTQLTITASKHLVCVKGWKILPSHSFAKIIGRLQPHAFYPTFET